jgi:hypothetical protein
MGLFKSGTQPPPPRPEMLERAAAKADAEISRRFELVATTDIPDPDLERSAYFDGFRGACGGAWKGLIAAPMDPEWFRARAQYAAGKLGMTEPEFGSELLNRISEMQSMATTASARGRSPIKDGSYGRMRNEQRWHALATAYYEA